MWTRLLDELDVTRLTFWTEVAGMGALMLMAALMGLGAFQVRRGQRWGWQWLGLSVLGLGVMAFLTISTPVRRAFIDLPMTELLGQGARWGLGAAWVGGVLWLAWRLARTQAGLSSAWLAGVLTLVLVGLRIFTFDPDLDERTLAVADESAIVAPAGVRVRLWLAEPVRLPSALAVQPDGGLLIAGREGSVWLAFDRDADGRADTVSVFAQGLAQPGGVWWHDGEVFVSTLTQVLALRDTNGDGAADTRRVVVDGLPGEQYAFHQPGGMTMDAQGWMYVGVGSSTDHSPETHPLGARILAFRPDGSEQRIFASGLRNPFGLWSAPGGLWAIDNGSSGCVDTPIRRDDCSDKLDVPEELNFVVAGGDYGFPNFYGIPPQDSGTLPPAVTFPDHASPVGVIQYTGQALPARYHNLLLVTLWARSEVWRVRVFEQAPGVWVGDTRPFISNLVGPSALVNAPDGGVWVASFSGNAIYHLGAP